MAQRPSLVFLCSSQLTVPSTSASVFSASVLRTDLYRYWLPAISMGAPRFPYTTDPSLLTAASVPAGILETRSHRRDMEYTPFDWREYNSSGRDTQGVSFSFRQRVASQSLSRLHTLSAGSMIRLPLPP